MNTFLRSHNDFYISKRISESAFRLKLLMAGETQLDDINDKFYNMTRESRSSSNVSDRSSSTVKSKFL